MDKQNACHKFHPHFSLKKEKFAIIPPFLKEKFTQ